MLDQSSWHQPVLLEAVLANLPANLAGTVLDVTLGFGGHSAAILEKMPAGAHLIGMDKDDFALETSLKRLSPLAAAKEIKLTCVKNDFKHLGNWLKQREDLEPIRFILADIGVSSPQIDQKERGFSYRFAGPLDMRMDQSQSLTCRDLLEQSDVAELTQVLRDYGEERYANRIAKAIKQAFLRGDLKTTLDLAAVVRQASPKNSDKDPAIRTFQALRIKVNDELGALENLLLTASQVLSPKGRLAIISFHSLEDRLVKQFFKKLVDPCQCLKDLPCTCNKKALGRIIGKTGFVATKEECQSNPRAHSARLRIFEKF